MFGRPSRGAEPVVLRQHDVGEVERADAEQHGDDDEADRDLVGHHLRGRAQRAEERIFRVRRPAAHDDAVDLERGDGEDVEDADIDVGDRPARVDRDHRPGRDRQHRRDQRRQQEHALVGAGRDDRLLEDELQQVGEGLQQAPRGRPRWGRGAAARPPRSCGRRRGCRRRRSAGRRSARPTSAG